MNPKTTPTGTNIHMILKRQLQASGYPAYGRTFYTLYDLPLMH